MTLRKKRADQNKRKRETYPHRWFLEAAITAGILAVVFLLKGSDGTLRLFRQSYAVASDRTREVPETGTMTKEREETEKKIACETESESETEGETESETETERDSDSEEDLETETEIGEEGKVETEAAGDSESEEVAETEEESEMVTEAEGESETEEELEEEPESESETGEKTEIEMEAESEGEPETECESETEKELESELETETEMEAESEGEPETECESETEKEPESESETGEKTETEMEAESEEEPGTECESEKSEETESDVESETELGIEPESEIGTESELETDGEIENERESETGETEIGKEPETGESETGQELETGEIENEREPETEGEFMSEMQTEIETDYEAEADAETESDAEPDAEAETAAENDTAQSASNRSDTEIQTGSENAEQSESTDQGEGAAGAETIVRDVHYRVTGDTGAWYSDIKDRIWIKAGTSIYIEPITGSGYNTGTSQENLQSDGIISFTLKKVKSDGTIVKESALAEEAYYVDGEAPYASFQITGNQVGAVIYASGSSTIAVSVEPDGKSGLKSTAYKIMACDLNGSVSDTADDMAWTSCASNAVLQISQEGIFRVYIMTVDMVGNVAYSRSGVICVDQTLPEITISGVEDQTANAGSVNLYVEGSDTYYKPGSLSVSIIGSNQGSVPTLRERGSSDTGEWISYYDFPELKSYDDVYEVSVTAQDLAGNIIRKTIQFSVNRFGSTYDLSAETKSMLEEYFLKEAGDVVFYETNIDYVGESQIYCRHDGTLLSLTAGTDYQVTMEGSETTWKRYCYTVSSACFSQEGVYELLLTSQDAAENQSDTGIQQKRVTFVLDRTAPACTISGVNSGGIYEEETVTMYVIPTDNIGLGSIRIYHNSELLEEDDTQPVSGSTIKVTLESDSKWQTVQVWLCDMSGNEYWSEEIPFFIGSAEQEVPLYEKVRKSAMELAAEEENAGGEQVMAGDSKEAVSYETASDVAESEYGQPIVNEDAGEAFQLADGTDEKDAIEEIYNTVADVSDAQLKQANKTTTDAGELRADNEKSWWGSALLLAGIFVFVVTAGSLYLNSTKRFK